MVENGITDESNVNTTLSQGTALGGPSETIFENPGVETLLRLFREAEIGIRNALKDVVVVLGCPEDAWGRIRDIPARMGQYGPLPRMIDDGRIAACTRV